MASQAQAPVTNTCSNAASLAVTITGVMAGNCLTFSVSYADLTNVFASPATPTDSNGSVSVAIAPNQVFGGGARSGACIYYVPNCNSGSHTITFNPGGGGSGLYAEASLVEWSGLTTAPLDKSTSNDQPSAASTTTTNTGTTSALSQSNELVVAALCLNAATGLANAGISTPATTGYTSIFVNQGTLSNVGAEHSYKEAGSTAGQIATWTYTSDSSMATTQAVIATFLENSVPPLISIKRSVVQLDTTIYY